MKKQLLCLLLATITLYTQTNIWKDAKHKASSIGAFIHKAEQAAKNEIKKDWRALKELLYLENKRTPYCDNFLPTNEPSIHDNQTDWINRVIAKYSPIGYLHENERAYPMSAQNYFSHPETQVVYQKDHTSRKPGPKKVLIEKGKTNPASIYELSLTTPKDKDIYVDIADCVKSGDNPEHNKDVDGNLITPAYVKAKQIGDKLYLTYVFFYGYNYPYQLKLPIFRIPLPPGQILNAHECDVEHVVQEFTIDENNSVTLNRMFFSTHGSAEGIWLDAQDATKNYNNIRISFEGTHPVVFIAKGGHGSYPREGTYVRIFGFANDRTQKDIRWTPKWVRLYEPEEPEFDPDIHGWVTLPGEYGKRGVSSLALKKWFTDPTSEFNDGNPKNTHFCPHPKTLEHDICVRAKTATAGIPK